MARPQILRRFLSITIVLLLTVVTAHGVLDNRSEDVRANDWVRDHAGRLPSTVSELRGFPVTYRKQIFARLPAQTRYELWRSVLAGYLETEHLNDEQRAFLQKMLATMSIQTFATEGSRNTQLREFCARIQKLWTKDESSRLFSALGRNYQRFGSLRATGVRIASALNDTVASKLVAHAKQPVDPMCVCALGGSWCESYCSDRTFCTSWGPGCGCFDMYTCDGFWDARPMH